MAVSYPTQTPGETGVVNNNDTPSWSFTVPSGLTNAVLIVAFARGVISDFGPGDPADGVTYDFGGGATSMTRLATIQESEGNAGCELWVAPIGSTNGSVTIDVDLTTDGTNRFIGCSFVLEGVDQTTPNRATADTILVSGTNTDYNPSVDAGDSAADDLVIGVVQCGGSVTSPNDTEISAQNENSAWYGNNLVIAYSAGGSGAIEISWGAGSDTYWRGIAVSFKAAGAAAATSLIFESPTIGGVLLPGGF